MQARSDLRPALAASAAFHAAIILAALLIMRLSPPIKPAPIVTPVTLVTEAGAANERAAEQAAERQAASAPEPTPEPQPPAPAPSPEPPAPAAAAPQPEPVPSPPRLHRRRPVAPEPLPEPAPEPAPRPSHRPAPRASVAPAPRPEPAPTPKPAAPPKARPQPAPAPEQTLDLSDLAKARQQKLNLAALSRSERQALNLGALASASRAHVAKATQSLDLSSLAGGGRASGPKGPARAETDRAHRLAAGAATALTGDEVGALKAKLIRLWHPNCGVEGGSGVDIQVEFKLTPAHELAGPPRVLSKKAGSADEAIVDAAAQRALAAVAQGAPYTELPKTSPLDFRPHFNAKEACSE